MRSTAVRRTALAASVAALALLGTACGSSPEPAAAAAGSGDEAGEGKTVAKALTAAELEKAALVQADVKSGTVTEKVEDDVAQDKVTYDGAGCAPLAYLQSGTYAGKPAATVNRTWKGEAEKPADGASDEEKSKAASDYEQAYITLASYEDGGAEQVMKDMNTAVEKCATGFSYTVDGLKNDVLAVATTTAPGGADEAIALTVSVDAGEGAKSLLKAVVVRKGATVAYVPVVNVVAAITGEDFDYPTEIIEAQLAKLN
ncbi:hypothetical protein RB628_06060 [Streptomyces sp. ADMS]|uniref:hypothetical protein n=1 Tax=Streptomyces sp. ADMS TaxID=3071415 RepID=UPI00296E98E2|nr:hypothetical protein [Streptomyces sp. ADMS]MDW4904923.1 hypothetical protein [Streptomyces sp. ADMS]